MNTLKPLAIIAILAAVGIGLYIKMDQVPEPESPPGAMDWEVPPAVHIGDAAGSPPSWPDKVTGPPTPSAPSDAPPIASSSIASAPVASQPLGNAGSATGASLARNGSPILGDSAAASTYPVPDTTAIAQPNRLPNEAERPLEKGEETSKFGLGSNLPGDPAAASRQPADPFANGQATGIAQTTPGRFSTYSMARQAAQDLLDREELDDALRLLSDWHNHPDLSHAERDELESLLGQLAGTVVYSTEHHLEPPHIVQPGETLKQIANDHRIPWELLANINGIDAATQLKPNQELKVLRGPFTATVDLAQRKLVLRIQDCYAGRFPVGLGKDHVNIEGHWQVAHKLLNPEYYGHSNGVAADDPNNPLGEHWIGLAPSTSAFAAAPFGIHGPHDPSHVDSDDPRGFIRLAPHDVKDVYNILSVGSKVVVRR